MIKDKRRQYSLRHNKQSSPAVEDDRERQLKEVDNGGDEGVDDQGGHDS